ncbi:MAG: response regulator transcription factor [Elusimicrobiales bacterium]|nr:response regulator transcription factor [Elusimicrobiales bacterium]
MKEKVLIIDDDKDFAKSLAEFLRKRDFYSYYALDSSIGIAMAKELSPSVIVSDVKMPSIDGITIFSIIRMCKETKNIPFILMSGEIFDENIQIKGYEKGIDDFLVKPFSYRILEAKIRKIINANAGRNFSYEVLERGIIKIDEEKKEVFVQNERIKLTKKEYEILTLLVKNPGKVFSVNYLLERIWNYNSLTESDKHTVEVHISNLRKKLKQAKDCIKNIVGFGYKFED